MHISVALTYTSAEAADSGRQLISAFDDALAAQSTAFPSLEGNTRLHFAMTLIHPVNRPPAGSPSARFHAPTNTIFASAEIDYLEWLQDDWGRRVEAVTAALLRVTGVVSKKRLKPNERAILVDLLQSSAARLKSSPPERTISLGSITLIEMPNESSPLINYGSGIETSIPPGAIAHHLLPADVESYLAGISTAPPPDERMFKLYQRGDRGLEYHEAWIAESVVVQHWGVCGERGETVEHPTSVGFDLPKLLKALKSKATSQGFRPIPLSRHQRLIVEASIAGNGTPADLDRRHALETFLDDRLGWSGLGHCDGGSIGSGSMEAFCYVIDLPAALATLCREMPESPFKDFRVRKAKAGIDY
jgi:hypothetical protein